jgi:hypothetical protein
LEILFIYLKESVARMLTLKIERIALNDEFNEKRESFKKKDLNQGNEAF